MAMYGVLQRFDAPPRIVKEIRSRIDEYAVPLAHEAPGFVAHRIYDLSNGVILSLDTFTDEASAQLWAGRVGRLTHSGAYQSVTSVSEPVVGRVHDRKRGMTRSAVVSPEWAEPTRSVASPTRVSVGTSRSRSDGRF